MSLVIGITIIASGMFTCVIAAKFDLKFESSFCIPSTVKSILSQAQRANQESPDTQLEMHSSNLVFDHLFCTLIEIEIIL